MPPKQCWNSFKLSLCLKSIELTLFLYFLRDFLCFLSILNHLNVLKMKSVMHDIELWWMIWYYFNNSGKNTENRDNHWSLPLSTWTKPSILLVEVASLHYFKEPDAILNLRRIFLIPTNRTMFVCLSVWLSVSNITPKVTKRIALNIF